MNLYKWGDMTVHVDKDTYVPPNPTVNTTEINILPDGTNNPATILQEAGRGRKRASFTGFALTEEDYISIQLDYQTRTIRLFTDTLGNTFEALILTFNPSRIADYYKYDIVLLEV